MLRAELEIFHSRPIAPTRRLALGRQRLPSDTNDGPGFGGLLLGAVCARFGSDLPHDFMVDLISLTHEIEQGLPVPQPRLRHRLQQDRVGLTRSRQRLFVREEQFVPEFDGSRATPSQLVLGTVYAVATVDPSGRISMMRVVRRGLAWRGEIDPSLFSYLADHQSSALSPHAMSEPVSWALAQLGLEHHLEAPTSAVVQRGFRHALRTVHPDLGASSADAAQRIAELNEARQILLAR